MYSATIKRLNTTVGGATPRDGAAPAPRPTAMFANVLLTNEINNLHPVHTWTPPKTASIHPHRNPSTTPRVAPPKGEPKMTLHKADVAVIGAGTAGLAAERHARRNGARTLLIDPRFNGTTCANTGCMPSKLLIAAADAAHTARTADTFGIRARPGIDGPAIMSRLRRLRDDFAAGVRDQIADLPEGTCLTARAAFDGPTRLTLDSGDSVEARAIVIATGSAPAMPGPFTELGEAALTNATLFELEDLPTSCGVIGAGPLGLELAQALARLGTHVEVFDAGATLAGLPEPTSKALHEALTKEFPIHLETEPQPERTADGIRLSWPGGTATFDRLLIAAGRPPALDALKLQTTGLELDDHGTPRFDPQTMQCGDAPIFLAGDASAARPVLHEASAEGAIAGRNAAAFPDVQPASRHVPLAITFTRPDAAVIGSIPEPGDRDALTGETGYANQGRARVMDRAHGRLRLHASADGQLTGADLCAPGGEHLAHLLAWAIQRGLTASEVLDLPFYHPTLEEGLKPALRDICHRAGLPRPWARDDDPLPGAG